MGLTRFRRLLDAYGADLQRWPPAERKFAQELILVSPEAARAWRETAQFDDLLQSLAPGVAESSIARVLDTLEATPPPRPVGSRRARSWASYAFFGAMALLGFLVGTM
jgi:hypothetical protein